MSSRPSLAAFGALAALSAAGCFPPEDPNDPLVRAKRDAAAAERGIIRRRRDRTWFLVKTWVREVPADAALLEGASPATRESARQRVNAAGLHLVMRDPPEGEHSSILLQENQSGFVALARGKPVRAFTLGAESYGGGDARADRGLEVVPSSYASGFDPGREFDFTPVFRGLAREGGELRVVGLRFDVRLATGEALVVDAFPDADDPDPVVRALFFDVPEEGKRPTRRRLYVQVEAFR